MPLETEARSNIDRLLEAAGWRVFDIAQTNIHAARGVAIREFPLKSGHGFADYLLYVDGKATGVIEAKKEGVTLTGVETQAAKYTQGLPDGLPRWGKNLINPPAWKPASPMASIPSRVPARCLPFTSRNCSPNGSLISPRSLAIHAAAGRRRPLARPDQGDPQPGTIPEGKPPARPDPDGHRLGQDLYLDFLHLPPDQVCRGAAHPVPGRSRQPRRPDP